MNPEYLQWAMTALLGIVLLYTVLGGMLSVLVTDYIQFLVMGLGLVITSVLVLGSVGWVNFTSGLTTAHENAQAYEAIRKDEVAEADRAVRVVEQTEGPEAAELLRKQQDEKRRASLEAKKGDLAKASVLVVVGDEEVEEKTMANPFNPVSSTGLGWMYVAWQVIFQIAVVTTWQTMITRVLSAKDSHTAKRVYRRTSFYFVGRFALPGVWGAAAFLYFSNNGGLPDGIDSLTAMPAYLKTLLPMGVIGVLIAAMLAAEMSTDSGYLLTWATVIYNDLITPCLRRPMSAKTKLFTVRTLVLAIGLFLLLYGLWYEIPGNAWDYLAVTGNIYLASVFTLLVGALYWRGANSWGAMAALILGAIGPITFLVVNGIVKSPRWNIDPSWEIPPEIAGFAAFTMSFAGMFFGSLLGRKMGRPHAASPATEATTEEVGK